MTTQPAARDEREKLHEIVSDNWVSSTAVVDALVAAGIGFRRSAPQGVDVVLEEWTYIADKVVEALCEMDDRNSPEDQPDMMLVNGTELHAIVLSALECSQHRMSCKAPTHPRSYAEIVRDWLFSAYVQTALVRYVNMGYDDFSKALAVLISDEAAKAVEREREACAQTAEGKMLVGSSPIGPLYGAGWCAAVEHIASAIRERTCRQVAEER